MSVHAGGGRVGLRLLGLGRTRDHARDRRSGEQPRDRELRERVPVIAGERVERLDPVEHLVGERVVDAVGGHPGQAGAGRRRLVAVVLAGEHAARQREVRDEPDTVALAGVEHTEALRPASQQAVLVLHAHETGEARDRR